MLGIFMDNQIERIVQIIGRLYLESQLQLEALRTELVKAQSERDQALQLLKNKANQANQINKEESFA